jgi:hypothetical protein
MWALLPGSARFAAQTPSGMKLPCSGDRIKVEDGSVLSRFVKVGEGHDDTIDGVDLSFLPAFLA